MSQAADINRDKRRLWAAPGGSHDRRVRVLARWLPGMVGVVAAAMIIQPLFPRGEVSFLLDRNKVAITQDRVRVADAMYRGIDNQGRPFTVTAGDAVQKSAREPVVKMNELAARIRMNDGPAELTAAHGSYDYDREQVIIPDQVLFTAADGYRMAAGNVSINLKTRQVIGNGGVNGSIPAGTFSANRIVADLGARTVALEGNARLLMAPGKLRMP
ncbi:LPS export ABC transporter periplasmic protein LptC [Novosphingobium sp.]|uniref:LPS export ABC transporter periplasmic protein LptC n=1 Tax=Novosphingobium sp. TaxID=1874826 RepID=UPI0025E4AF1E|nr:LPS export ABC transporter periplasmic protein LptC [Novosphingobium sp.]